ncbi:hypothetical protein [Elizabethkingia miricola]|uniref:hypothetical protein n=1 Tax=Elizabethkingia miricola TaxID=172045 RepID=UPI003891C458
MKKSILLIATAIVLFSNIGCREAEELGTIGGSTSTKNTASVNDTKLTNDNIIKNLKDQEQDPKKKNITPIAEYNEQDRHKW